VFESAPTLAEAVRDVADSLTACGALTQPVQVVANSGDGGAIAIGLRALLHTIHRRARVTIMVLVNEIFANTGFQYSPAAMPFADTSTTPVGPGVPGNLQLPIDYVHLAIAAGAELVAQVSPAHGKLFLKTMERALESTGTAVVFVPAPCISGWKFDDGKVVDCPVDQKERPPIEAFLAAQRRFQHLVRKNADTGAPEIRPGREADVERVRAWAQGNVERLYKLAEMK